MPSAPISTSASATSPSANVRTAAPPSAAGTSTLTQRLPRRTASSGTAWRSASSRSARCAVEVCSPVQALAPGVEVLGRQHGAVAPAPELPAGLQPDRRLEQPVEHAEPAQQPGHVRGDDQAGPDLRQLPGLLVDGGRETGLVEERGGPQPADAAADDRDLQCHPAIMPVI